jgi:hypothetical protein
MFVARDCSCRSEDEGTGAEEGEVRHRCGYATFQIGGKVVEKGHGERRAGPTTSLDEAIGPFLLRLPASLKSQLSERWRSPAIVPCSQRNFEATGRQLRQ